MKSKSHKVSPIKRLAATIYDLFLLLGVWFAVGSIALWANGGEILNPVSYTHLTLPTKA